MSFETEGKELLLFQRMVEVMKDLAKLSVPEYKALAPMIFQAKRILKALEEK